MPKKESLDKHHLSYEPPVTELIPHRQHQDIHGNVPIVNELTLKMRQYDKLVKLSVMIQNWAKAYRREFDEEPIDSGLGNIQKKKEEIMKDIKLMIKDELKKVVHIKGLGPRYLAGLLAYAHPNRFPNVGRYLLYCGYTKASKITKKYNRKVSGLVYQIMMSLIRNRDKRYYPIYIRIKNEQSSDFSRVKRHRIAINRTGTLFLKEFYKLFK